MDRRGFLGALGASYLPACDRRNLNHTDPEYHAADRRVRGTKPPYLGRYTTGVDGDRQPLPHPATSELAINLKVVKVERASRGMIPGILLTLVWLVVTASSAGGGWTLWLDGKRIAHFEMKDACMAEAKRNIMKFPVVPGHKPESSESSWSVLAPRLAGGASVVRYDCLHTKTAPGVNGQ